MKNTTIKFDYSEEKLLALNSYLEKKDTDLDTELVEVVDKLYEKFVPSQVREFIETKEELVSSKSKKAKQKVEKPNNSSEN